MDSEIEKKLLILAENYNTAKVDDEYSFDFINDGVYYRRLRSLEFHTSFDWSVPVWKKCISEISHLFENGLSIMDKEYHTISGTMEMMEVAIRDNNKLKFFNGLVDLISVIKKIRVELGIN